MLIVIAGFPSVFIGVFFGSSLIIETIFSLDGLGRMGFEAAVARDYPVIFGTLFGLLGGPGGPGEARGIPKMACRCQPRDLLRTPR